MSNHTMPKWTNFQFSFSFHKIYLTPDFEVNCLDMLVIESIIKFILLLYNICHYAQFMSNKYQQYTYFFVINQLLYLSFRYVYSIGWHSYFFQHLLSLKKTRKFSVLKWISLICNLYFFKRTMLTNDTKKDLCMYGALWVTVFYLLNNTALMCIEKKKDIWSLIYVWSIRSYALSLYIIVKRRNSWDFFFFC